MNDATFPHGEVDPVSLRAVLRLHAAGVVVVTAPGEPPAGFTSTSFSSVSLAPPLVSFSLSRTASAWPAVYAAEVVAVHLLRSDQDQIARTFATGGIDRFAAHGGWHPGPGGVPLLDDVLATLVCRVFRRVTAGDHTIMLATPQIAGVADPFAKPLVYHDGAYNHITAHPGVRAPSP